MASTSPSTDAAGPLRSLVWLATAATTLTAAWLIGVSIAVLPQRDPARVGFWLVVAAALLGFAALTATHLARWGGAPDRWLAATAGVAATAAGTWLAITTVAATGEFEGYLLLIGLVVAAHGGLATVSAARG